MKQTWKPGNMLYPLPVVLVSTRGLDGKDNESSHVIDLCQEDKVFLSGAS